MAEPEKRPTITLQDLMVSTLAMADALSKLLIEKGAITDEEFKQKLGEERATIRRFSSRLSNEECTHTTRTEFSSPYSLGAYLSASQSFSQR